MRTESAALASLDRGHFQLSLLGLMIPDLVWLDCLPAILKNKRAGTCLLIAGGHDARTLRALHALAPVSIFDPINHGPMELRTALASVAAGHRYISRTIENVVRADAKIIPEELLSDTEEFVLSVIGDGSDDLEASERLNMKEGTVSTHRKNIMRSLGLHHRGELMRFALNHGYLARRLDGTVGPGIAAILKRAGAP